MLLPAVILGTGSALPEGEPRTTQELARRALPDKDPVEIERRVGIATRSWLAPEESAAELAARALRPALAAAGLEPEQLRRLIFVSSTGGDRLIPATANDVLERLGLDDTCDAFDLNNSCAGFLNGFDVAARSVATGLGPVAVVAAESFSRYLSPSVPRSYLVLGDAAAAVIVGPRGLDAEERGGGVFSWLRSSADLRGRMTTDHPGRTGRVEYLEFAASHDELTGSAVRLMQRSTSRVLDEAGLTTSDVDWFLPHQPNGTMLDRILDTLGFDRERTVNVVRDIGSTGAASIPTSLDRLLRTRPVRPGDRILMAGVGGGTGYGALLYQLPREHR